MRNTSSNPSSAKRFYAGLWAVVFACLMPAMTHAQTGFETMDQKTLVAQADLLKERLNKTPADYEALRSLGTPTITWRSRTRRLMPKRQSRPLKLPTGRIRRTIRSFATLATPICCSPRMEATG